MVQPSGMLFSPAPQPVDRFTGSDIRSSASLRCHQTEPEVSAIVLEKRPSMASRLHITSRWKLELGRLSSFSSS